MKLRLLIFILYLCCLLPATSWAVFTIDNGNGTLTDTSSGLVWLQNANCTDTAGGIAKPNGYLNWADAQTWSNALASGPCSLSDGSHAGEWRLPSIDELKSLMCRPGAPAWMYNGCDGSNSYNPAGAYPFQWLTTQGFSAVQGNFYWSSSTYPGYPDFAWGVDMFGGYVGTAKYGNYYVWPVRGGQWGDSVISGTVHDAATAAPLADTAVNIGGTRIVQTDAAGAYRINIVPGAYPVTASKSGYETQSTSVTSTSGQTSVQNFNLFLPAVPPNLATPATENVGAGMATLLLQSSDAGTGYFTLLTGSGAACGTGAQVAAGQTSTGVTAPYHGSLPLTANTPGRYTVRNLTQSTAYTVCFTADSPSGANLNPTPVSANLTTTATASFTNPGWNTLGTAGFSAGGAYYTSLAVAADGTPYLAYMDVANGYKATVMKHNGASWVLVGSAGFSASDAYYPSLAIAPDGTPYVAYQDAGSGNRATVKKFNGTSWVTVGTVGFSAGVAYFTSLAIAPDGTLNVAYQDSAKSYKATVMTYTGASWVPVGSTGFSAAGVSYLSLAFAPNGTLAVAYMDGGNGNRATVMTYNGSAWVPLGSAGFSAGDAAWLSLKFTPTGTATVAYTDYINSYKATVMQYTGSAWGSVGGTGFTAGAAWYTSLAAASDGSLTLAYQDGDSGNKATVMKYTGSAWSAVGSAGFSTGMAQDTSLAFAPDGTPYLAYNDPSLNGKAVVMKLVSKIGTITNVSSDLNPANLGQSVTFTATVSPNSATGTVTFKDNGSELGIGTLSGGTATFSTSALSAGSHSITAVYTGDNTYAGSTSTTLTQTVEMPPPPTFTTPATENVGTGLATLVLQSSGTGSGYFTLLTGSGAACGTGAQVAAGQTSTGTTAPYHGSLPLIANTPGRYTVRNLTQSTAYTVCFTADSPSGANLNPTPVAAVFTTTAVASINNPAWVAVGSSGFTPSVAISPSLAIAPDGTPYVAFMDATIGYKGTVMKYSGGAWNVVGGGSFSTDVIQSPSLAFAPDGTPCVAYSDGGNGGKATVMQYRDGVWSAVGNAGFSPDLAGYTSLAFAPDGTPTVAFRDGTNVPGGGGIPGGGGTPGIGGGGPVAANGKATVMQYRDGVWSTVGSAGFSNGTATYISLAFAPDGSPTVAYQEDETQTRGMVMQYRTGSWSVVGGTGFSDNGVEYVSLAFAPDGTPFVAYNVNGTGPTVSSFNGEYWSAVGGGVITYGGGYYTSLAIAPDGALIVAFADASSRATVTTYRNGSWSPVGGGWFSDGYALETSLALAPDGTPYVVYRDWAANEKATVMKLVSGKIGSTISLNSDHNPATAGQTVTFTATVSPTAATGSVTFKDGSTVLGTGTLTSGTATFNTSTLTASSHTITAVYAGNGSYAGSTSTPLTQTVQATVSVTVTVPAGRSFTVEGNTYIGSNTFTWAPLSSHSIIMTSPQAGTTGTRYVFASWLDGGTASRTITAPASGSATYTATFTTQYQLTTAVNSATMGTVSPVSGTWYTASSLVLVKAFTNAGYSFVSWNGPVNSASAATTVTMAGPQAITANFAGSPLLSAAFSAKKTNNALTPNVRTWDIKVSNSGQSTALSARISGLTLTQTFGAACSPGITLSQFPVLLSDIPVSGSATGSATIDFTGCISTARFTAVISYSSNSAAVTGSTSYGNQFR